MRVYFVETLGGGGGSLILYKAAMGLLSPRMVIIPTRRRGGILARLSDIKYGSFPLLERNGSTFAVFISPEPREVAQLPSILGSVWLRTPQELRASKLSTQAEPSAVKLPKDDGIPASLLEPF